MHGPEFIDCQKDNTRHFSLTFHKRLTNRVRLNGAGFMGVY